MELRSFVQRSARLLLAAGMVGVLSACGGGARALSMARDQFNALRDTYFIRVLELNPVASMFLAGTAFDPALQGVNGRLRDFRPEAISREVAFFREVQRARNAIRPELLAPDDRIDHAVLGAQVSYILYQLEALRYYERCVDTYVTEPYRGVDWQIQRMEPVREGMRGTHADWELVVTRMREIPAYLDAARTNLLSGKVTGNVPTNALVEREGIQGSRTNADYFRVRLPSLARRQIGDRDFAAELLPRLDEAAAVAGAAYDAFASFLEETYEVGGRQDQFAGGARLPSPGPARGELLEVVERVVLAGYAAE